MTDEQIKHMVERFLRWRLPENFAPDAGISFKADFNEHTAHPMKHEPVGTNLFDYTQTEAMVRHMIDGLPADALAAWPVQVGRESRIRELFHHFASAEVQRLPFGERAKELHECVSEILALIPSPSAGWRTIPDNLHEAIEEWLEIDGLTSPPCTVEMLRSSDRRLYAAIRAYGVASHPVSPRPQEREWV